MVRSTRYPPYSRRVEEVIENAKSEQISEGEKMGSCGARLTALTELWGLPSRRRQISFTLSDPKISGCVLGFNWMEFPCFRSIRKVRFYSRHDPASWPRRVPEHR